MSMCMPSPGSAPGWRFSRQHNVYVVASRLPGPRGVDSLAAPNWLMVGASHALGGRQTFNVELMATAELWTFPDHGYPELMQVGEDRADGSLYLDAQHPHSSPVMGLSFSDTFELGESRRLTLSFAPRGASTDGPIAFMHRESARDNPDAPLGHHVAQDVGHISSTVVAANLDLGRFGVELSGFNGAEPSPSHVDLPMGPLDSSALRLRWSLATDHQLMASVAEVRQHDEAWPDASGATRLSFSLYDRFRPAVGALDHSLVLGRITRHPGGDALHSLLDEWLLGRGRTDWWQRTELLQRLRSELEITAAPLASDERRWVGAVTVGMTHWLNDNPASRIGVGASLTMNWLPADWASDYGGRHPLSARLILQWRGAPGR